VEKYKNMLNATRFAGATLLSIGIAIFLYGVFISDYKAVVGVGIGTVMGAVFIFLIGLFLIASEEMVTNSRK
jgi:uncharacterized membrane protein YiaA